MNPELINCSDLGSKEYRELCSALSPMIIPLNKQSPSFITGVKEVDILNLEKVSDRYLKEVCLTNKYVYGLCQEDSFWSNRIISKFGEYLGTLEESDERLIIIEEKNI